MSSFVTRYWFNKEIKTISIHVSYRRIVRCTIDLFV